MGLGILGTSMTSMLQVKHAQIPLTDSIKALLRSLSLSSKRINLFLYPCLVYFFVIIRSCSRIVIVILVRCKLICS